jgi:hypothetical protein
VELETLSISNSFENTLGTAVTILAELKYILRESLPTIEWELSMDCKAKVKRDSSFLYLKEKNSTQLLDKFKLLKNVCKFKKGN